MIRVGVIGNGTVGKALIEKGAISLPCDITVPESVREAVVSKRPDVIINLAAKADVDWCEDKKNAEEVILTNVRGAYNVCDQANELKYPVVLLSSDHVFDGGKRPFSYGPYKEDATPNPVNFYGSSKFAMEGVAEMFNNVKTVRTSYLFHISRGQVAEYLYDLSLGQRIHPATFIKRSFMYLPHFIDSLWKYLQCYYDMPKMLNIAGTDTASWYEFAMALAGKFGYDTDLVIPRKKESDKLFAPRPRTAGLRVGKSRKLGLPQYSYVDGIRQMWADNLVRELGYVG